MPQSLAVETAEAIEVAVWHDLFAAAREVGRGDVLVERRPEVLLTSVPSADVLAHNRGLGLGALQSPQRELVEEIVEWYRAAGAARFMVPLAPVPRQQEIAGWLEAAGLVFHNRWVKLARDASAPTPSRTELRIDQLQAGQGHEFAELVGGVFDWPEAARAVLAPTVGSASWWHCGAWEGPRLVAAGGLFMREGIGWLGPAATLPDARGRGAQSALIGRRLEAGIAAGCRAFVVETAEETPDRQVPSTRNLRRLGFEIMYLRPNYRLTLR